MSDVMHTQMFASRTSRRTFVKTIGATAAVASFSTLLAACGTDDEDEIGEVVEPDDDDEEVEAVEPDDDDDEVEVVEPDDDDEDVETPETEDDAEPAEPGAGGTANISFMSSDPTTMNPLFTRSGIEQGVTALHFGSLVLMDETMAPVPSLAESWEISDDAMHVTFDINEDANWSDGEAFTAEDVIFTFERALHAETGSTRAAIPQFIEGGQEFMEGGADSVAGLSASDPKTLEIQLAEPNSVFVFRYAAFQGFGTLPKHIYEDIGPGSLEGHELSRTPEVGAGPFLFSRWETGQFLEFTANEGYPPGSPSLDRLILRILHDDVALAQLETQEIELTSVPVDEIERVERDPNVELVTQPSLSITSLMADTGQAYLTLPIRQAFMYAINRQGIVDSVYQGLAEVVHTAVIGPEWMGDIIADADLNTYEYDPERAQAILDDEGWDPEQSLELMYATGAADDEPAMNVIQDNLRAVGVNLELRSYEPAELRERRERPEGYDLALLRGGIYRAEPATAVTYYLPNPDGTDNVLRYNNPRFNELEAQGLREVDVEERREIYLEMAKILNEELPNLYLWSPHLAFGINPRLQGFKVPNYVSNILWNTEEWTIES